METNDNTHGYIYLIKCGHTDYYKIGFAKDVQQRLLALQAANPVKLHLIATAKRERSEETVLHNEFSAYWHRNEWFKFDKEKVNKVLLFFAEKRKKVKKKSKKKGRRIAVNVYDSKFCERCGCPATIETLRKYKQEIVCSVCANLMWHPITKRTVSRINSKLIIYRHFPEVPVPIWFVKHLESLGFEMIKKTCMGNDDQIGDKEWWESEPPMYW